MKKITFIIILSILICSLVGCTGKTEQQDNKTKKDISVRIVSNSNQESFSKMPITLTPKLLGEYSKEVQYHWILDNEGDFEGFYIPENGPQKEIINFGEPVELDLFATVSYIEGARIEFKVKLQVEDKETRDIIASNQIIIENHEGIYKVKNL